LTPQAEPAKSGRLVFASGKVEKVVYLGATVEYEIDASFNKTVVALSHDPVDEGFSSLAI